MAEVAATQPETEFVRLQRDAQDCRAAAQRHSRSMNKLNLASGVVLGVGGALLGLAFNTTPSLAEHDSPQTPVEWVEIGVEVTALAAQAAILARTLQHNQQSNRLEAQASQALMHAAEIPPYQR